MTEYALGGHLLSVLAALHYPTTEHALAAKRHCKRVQVTWKVLVYC